MKWKDANKYKPKKHPRNSMFSVDVVLSFGIDVLDEPNAIGYYDFFSKNWVHDGMHPYYPIAFLEYPEFTNL